MSIRLVLICLEPEQCSVVFEPYGAEYILAAEDRLQLDIGVSDSASEDDSALEVAYSPGCITVWLPTSIVSIQAANRKIDGRQTARLWWCS